MFQGRFVPLLPLTDCGDTALLTSVAYSENTNIADGDESWRVYAYV